MKRHITNAMYGALDYASYPLGMLLAAPIILRRLGAAEYGLWMVSTAVVSAGSIIASGFSDAGIQRTAKLHGANETGPMLDTIRTMFAINLALGFAIAVLAWIAAPYAARHLSVSRTMPVKESLNCLRIACVVILVRSIEAVSVTTQRAFQQYRGTVQISTAVRILTLTGAIVLALLGRGTQSIMIATAVFLAAGACFQFWHLRTLLGTVSLCPRFSLRKPTAYWLRASSFGFRPSAVWSFGSSIEYSSASLSEQSRSLPIRYVFSLQSRSLG
jgi:O-antigen/teichoic acid export membrane protein